MIDRAARKKMAELLRHFIARRITNDELCDNLPTSKIDHSVNEIEIVLQVSFEMGTYRLRAQSYKDRLELARIVMFLYTDLEMADVTKNEWGSMIVCFGPLLLLPLFIAYALLRCVWDWLCKKPETEDFWPFQNAADYEDSLKHPKLLCGKPIADFNS